MMVPNVYPNPRETSHDDDEDDDHISQLPEDVLIAIVSCLPFKDAFRTSILSSRWRNCWKHTSSLNFESDAWRNRWKHASDIDFADAWEKHVLLDCLSFVDGVDTACEACESPSLVEFRVCYDLDNSWQRDITKWVKYALGKKVQRLELDLSDHPGTEFPKMFRSKCDFRRNFLKDRDSPLTSLKVLSLKCVNVSGEDIEFYLARCPFLEQLVVWSSDSLTNLNVSDPSLKLKHLEIRDCQQLDQLAVENINLNSLFLDTPETELFVKNLPKLVDVSVSASFYPGSYKEVFYALRDCLHQLEVLTLSGGTSKQIIYDDEFPELKKLKKLVLDFWADRNKNFLQLVSRIKAAPLLEEFVLELRWKRNLTPKHEETVEMVAGSPHRFLKVVQIHGYTGRPSELELVRYFCKNALALEKIVVDPRSVFETLLPMTEEETKNEENRRDYVTRQLAGEVPEHVQLVIL